MGSTPENILVVDDDAAMCRALCTTLKGLGMCVAACSTGEEALAVLRTNTYDVVLLDLNMPAMGGIAACREIRRLYPNVEILIMTVRDTLADKAKGLEAGADDYVTKPFHVRELIARIKAIKRRGRALGKETGSVIPMGDAAVDPEGAENG